MKENDIYDDTIISNARFYLVFLIILLQRISDRQSSRGIPYRDFCATLSHPDMPNTFH